MWIERYTANGRTYYRARSYKTNPIHLGTAEDIVRKVRGVEVAKRTKKPKKPTKNPEEEPADTHEDQELPELPAFKGD